MRVTSKDLAEIFERPETKLRVWADALEPALEEFQMNTLARTAMFLAQTGHESAGYRVLVENLNYSAKALRSVFGKYFVTQEDADRYARDQPAIANRVYGNRMGNGPEASGDGWKYRGRGILQVTGKSNYEDLTDWMDSMKFPNPNFVARPDVLVEPIYSVQSAMWYWEKHSLNLLADKDDFLRMTRRINGGHNGLDHRLALYGRAIEVLGG